MMRKGLSTLVAVLSAMVWAPVAAAQGAKPLFSDDGVIRITIRGPVSGVVRMAADSKTARPAALMVPGEPEALPIKLSARGRTRRQTDNCQFPPLRVEFDRDPGGGSVFEGQKKLKLVTHCQSPASFQQYQLLEYLIYRAENLLTPLSFRARLAQVDYVEGDGRLLTSRRGFFLEDESDVARRNGLRHVKVPDHIGLSQLDPMLAARDAVFQFMIGNVDWSMTTGPRGEDCCHNVKLIAPQGATSGFAPLPYDYDSSGLVDAPYAVPPQGVTIANVKVRRYRGYCRHNAEARVAAAELRDRRGEILAIWEREPMLDEAMRRKALSYLDGFFEQVSTDGGVDRMLKTCLS